MAHTLTRGTGDHRSTRSSRNTNESWKTIRKLMELKIQKYLELQQALKDKKTRNIKRIHSTSSGKAIYDAKTARRD
jgi:hypothetical protein